MIQHLDNIVDVIIVQGVNPCIVVKEMPDFRYKKTMSLMEAESRGFASTLLHQRPSKGYEAFAGRRIEFKLEDGTIEVGVGQWWDHIPTGRWMRCGVASLENLAKCYVFMGTWVSVDLLQEWLTGHTAQADYWHYATEQQRPRVYDVKVAR